MNDDPRKDSNTPPSRRLLRRRTRLGLLLIAGLLALPHVAGCVSAMGGSVGSEQLEVFRLRPHHNGETFVNTVETEMGMDVWDTLDRWANGEEVREPLRPIPIDPIKPGALAEASEGLRVTWLGHSSALIEIEGKRVLTDPVWSDRVSPTSWVGPERFHPVPIDLGSLPPLDAVIISHDHYDHLDEPTVRGLAATGVRFYVPLGVSVHLRAWDVPESQIVELDWWDRFTTEDGRLSLVCTPARHFSGRGPFDRNETLWASWAIVGQERRVYFGGDTGMFDGFGAIGDALGPFDLTLMPIGAYDKNWKAIHLDPEEAVQAHLDVEGGVMLPIHWATFNLAMHAWDEPPRRLLAAAEARGVTLATPKVGEMVEVGEAMEPFEPWW